MLKFNKKLPNLQKNMNSPKKSKGEVHHRQRPTGGPAMGIVRLFNTVIPMLNKLDEKVENFNRTGLY